MKDLINVFELCWPCNFLTTSKVIFWKAFFIKIEIWPFSTFLRRLWPQVTLIDPKGVIFIGLLLESWPEMRTQIEILSGDDDFL